MIAAPDQRMYAASKGLKLQEATSQQVTELFSMLAVITGHNTPSAEAMMLIRNLVVEMMPGVTVEDIALAVKMNITKQLPDHVTAYGELSGAYICEVLTLYMPLRGKARLKYQEIEQRPELPERQITDTDWLDMHERDLLWYQNGKVNWEYCAARMVRWLYETERMKDDDFTADEWKRIRMEARQRVMDRQRIGHRAIEAMPAAARERFDQDCLVEVRTVVYGEYLKRKG